MADLTRRDSALRHWLRDPVTGALDMALQPVFRALGVDVCSDLGARFGVAFARQTRGFAFHDADRRARANWQALRPDAAGPDETDRAVRRMWRDMGRTLTEFAVLDRLWPAGRIAVEGAEHLAAARASGRPVLVMGLHLGNWEVIGPTLAGLGYGAHTMYQPPDNRFDHRVVVRARLRAGMRLIPPWPSGARPLLRALEGGDRMVLIYADDFIGGRVGAPRLGRSGEARGNLVNIARLAALSGAVVVPAHALRGEGARFKVVFREAAIMTARTARGAAPDADVQRLNELIEPVVRKHLAQWYWLANFGPDDQAHAAPDPLGGRLSEGRPPRGDRGSRDASRE